jgi:UDP-GlcNAc:undecaprenyl-phosphate/decaprenyl-phosphate GlcNAc-1-phosphate transferase
MYAILFLGLTSFLVCLAITPVIRKILLRWGILDFPDGGRKLHPNTVARAGGLSLAISYPVALAAVMLIPSQAADFLKGQLNFTLTLLPAAGLVFVTGLADDIVNLRPSQKLIGQFAGAVLAWLAGVRIHGFSDHMFGATLSFAITVAWLIICTNAFNLIDGVDGLTAGAGFLAAVTMLVAALLENNLHLAVVTAPLAGALLAMLKYNSNPASIFMGDCGSLTIGFMLGCFGVIWSQKSATMLGMAAPVIALGLPLLDMGLAIIRRFLRLKPISSADRAHIHHRLLDRGLTPRRVTLLLYGISGIAAALSLLASVVQGRLAGLAILMFCACAWIGVHHLKYIEFEVAKRVLFQRFRRILESEITVVSFQERIAAATTLDECWEQIVRAAEEFGFAQVRLSIGPRFYEETLRPINPVACWNFQIPLSETDYIEFKRPVRSEFHPWAAVPFFELARNSLRPSLARFQTEPRSVTEPVFVAAIK